MGQIPLIHTKMKTKNYWNSRYNAGGNSGYGSYGEQKDKKLGWLKDLDFDHITDIGCGDFHFSNELLKLHPASYTGFDISGAIVEKNKVRYPEHKHDFYNYESGMNLPKSDLVICLDVLFHIYEEDEYEEMLHTLKTLPTKYLAVTAYEREQKDGVGHHIHIRDFPYKDFGVPLIREIIEEDGQLYFYLFKK